MAVSNQRYLNHYGSSRTSPQPMVFSHYPPGSPLVPRRRGNYSTTTTPLDTHHNKLGRRRSLSLDDLGLKTTGSANNYHTLNSTSHKEVEQTPDESFSNLCDTDDDLDELSSMLEENPPDLLNLDAGNSSSGGELEITSLSTIRESSPVHSVEEWSPTPNEDEQIDSNSVKSLDNRQTLHKDSTTKTRSHPIGFVNNYISKWKNKIKK